MSTYGQGVSKPGLVLAGLGYFAMLSVALVWWHLPPETVLALSVGGIGLVVLSMRPYVGVHVFIMTLFVENVFGSGEGITPMKVIGAVVLSGWFVNMGIQRKTGFKFDRFVIVLILFLVWCGVSLAFAVEPGVALSRVFTYTQLALATLMFSSVVDTPGRMRGVYWSFVIWVTFSTLLAVVMYYLGMTPNASGLVGNRNLLATYINVAIVCAYLLHQETRDGARRIVLVTCLPVLFLGLALTFSRAGLIVLVFALALVWYRVVRQRKFLLLVGTIGMMCMLTFVLPAAFWQRAGSIVPAIRKQEDTFGTRLRLWRVALRMVEDRPIVGVGPGNYVAAYPRYARGGDRAFESLVTHNAFMGIAAQTGVLGLGLFLLISGLALRDARRAVFTGRVLARSDMEIFGVVAEVCLLVVLMEGLSGDVESLKCLWIFYGLAVAMGRKADRVTSGERLAAARIGTAIPVDGLSPWVPARPRQ